MALNVNRNVSDAFYRYKMPRLVAKVEGRGNGIKTVLVNISDIAKALGRPPTYITKFFGCELGAQTQFDTKHDRFVVNGTHEATKLQEMLDVFIKEFVLCTRCDNPETVLTVHSKKQTIALPCKACGYNGQLNMARHDRMAKFILKNPPEINPAVHQGGTSLTEGTKSKRSSSKNTDITSSSGKQGPSKNGSEYETDDDSETNGLVAEADDDDWAVDVDEAAVKARMEALTSRAKALTTSEDLEKTHKERVDIFYNSLKKLRDQGMLSRPEVYEKIFAEAERVDVGAEAPLIICELVFDNNILTQLKTYQTLIMRFTRANAKAQKALLRGMECVISLHQRTLLPKVAHILNAMYQYDLVEEEILLEWGSKPSDKYISKQLNAEILAKAIPFLEWLENAEEAESDDESDQNYEKNEHADWATLVQNFTTTAQPYEPLATIEEENDEDDLNIDDI